MALVNSPERREIEGVVTRLLDLMSATVSSKSGRDSAALRNAIGDMRANFMLYLAQGTFADNLLECFTVIVNMGGELPRLAAVHQQLFLEEPVGQTTGTVVQLAISLCLAAESQVILSIEFTSRDEVDELLKRTREAFDTARELSADSSDPSFYKTLTSLAGSVTRYLADTARPLSRIVTFVLPDTMPALALSNRIYYDPARWEEIIEENKTVHPAFCQREIRGLAT